MRRTLTALASLLALSLAVPAAALAHHGHTSRRHPRHLRRHERRHHHAKSARLLRFAPVEGEKSTEKPAEEPGKEPVAPSSSEVIGTITAMEGETLTIKLNDGTMLTGKLGKDTRVGCVSSSPSTEGGNDGSGFGGEDESGWQQDQRGPEAPSGRDGGGDQEASAEPEPESGEGDHHPEGDSHGGCCEEGALAVGESVRDAGLAVTSSGSFWEWLVVVK